jgi:hypothetical protein
MKKTRTILSALLISATLFSCGKGGDEAITGGGNMTAKVDGSGYSATLAVQATLSGTSPKVLSVAGTGSSGQINITLSNYTGPATYVLGSGVFDNIATFTLTASPFTSYSASGVLGSGTVKITSDSGGYVEGTFSFSGKNNAGGTITTKDITEGNFKIKL